MDNENDLGEFVRLMREHKGIVYKVCNSYCSNREDREDLAQEIIYQLWRSGNTFRAGQKFSTWMYRVALNVAISFYRKRKSANAVVSYKEHLTEIEDQDDTDYENELERARRILQQSIHEMKELDRALIILFLEAKGYREIAEILGITETNVATKINRIKEKLKQKILANNK